MLRKKRQLCLKNRTSRHPCRRQAGLSRLAVPSLQATMIRSTDSMMTSLPATFCPASPKPMIPSERPDHRSATKNPNGDLDHRNGPIHRAHRPLQWSGAVAGAADQKALFLARFIFCFHTLRRAQPGPGSSSNSAAVRHCNRPPDQFSAQSEPVQNPAHATRVRIHRR